MYEIAWQKLDVVYGMTKVSFPVTANIVMKFDQVKFLIENDLFFEGMLIVDDMFVEMKNGRNVHKMYDLNGDLFDLLKRAEKRQRRNHSALIFLPRLISQYLSGSQLL